MILRVLFPTPPLTLAINIDFAESLFENLVINYTFFNEIIKFIALSYISFSF